MQSVKIKVKNDNAKFRMESDIALWLSSKSSGGFAFPTYFLSGQVWIVIFYFAF